MNRLPYTYVLKHVDKLYEKKFAEHDIKGINDHCEFICAFIKASGWSEDDFIRASMGFQVDEPKYN